MVSVQGDGIRVRHSAHPDRTAARPAGIYLTRRPMAAKWQAPATTVQVCHTSW